MLEVQKQSEQHKENADSATGPDFDVVVLIMNEEIANRDDFYDDIASNADSFEEMEAIEVKQELDLEEISIPASDGVNLYAQLPSQRSKRKERPAV